ncbi:hypothetical protein [Cecembia lonarensis]|uniref:Uncharacterized protein n=1 Tax=Cecembia lonarensis (strain CCUG 58316 / KCTC 22772 / LW9) TaxID=1225176 RepID=K1KXW9_CECL9|nr:hypothetical protein [Cecembia lonarensis]EKB47301.1 hypothetical protein B879_04099 [Cecembia lonarensis LW9]
MKSLLKKIFSNRYKERYNYYHLEYQSNFAESSVYKERLLTFKQERQKVTQAILPLLLNKDESWDKLQFPDKKADITVNLDYGFRIQVYRTYFHGIKAKIEWHSFNEKIFLIRFRFQFLDEEQSNKLKELLHNCFLFNTTDSICLQDPSGLRLDIEESTTEHYFWIYPKGSDLGFMADHLQKSAD